MRRANEKCKATTYEHKVNAGENGMKKKVKTKSLHIL